jgi:hypothetical protein
MGVPFAEIARHVGGCTSAAAKLLRVSNPTGKQWKGSTRSPQSYPAHVMIVDRPRCFLHNKNRKGIPEIRDPPLCMFPFTMTSIPHLSWTARGSSMLPHWSAEKVVNPEIVREEMVNVISRAFDRDPVFNWIVKQDHRREERIRLVHEKRPQLTTSLGPSPDDERGAGTGCS